MSEPFCFLVKILHFFMARYLLFLKRTWLLTLVRRLLSLLQVAIRFTQDRTCLVGLAR